jgi:hypothetical protein
MAYPVLWAMCIPLQTTEKPPLGLFRPSDGFSPPAHGKIDQPKKPLYIEAYASIKNRP